MWIQYVLFTFGLALVGAFAKDASDDGDALASFVVLMCSIGMLSLFFHAITGGQ